MIIDTFTIVACAVAMVLAIATPFISPFFRKVRLSDKTYEPRDWKCVPVSVVISVHNAAEALERNIGAWLSQDYPADYQLIVVADEGDSATDDILKRYADDPHLQSTFVPKSSRYMSRKKLAITLGVKAARHEWIVLTEAFSRPATDKYLLTMARNFDANHNLVIGYSQYDSCTRPYYRYERLRKSLYLLRTAQRGIAYRTNGTSVAFRKDEFIAQDGYRGNLESLRGEYDFLVNKYAIKGATAVETAPEAWIIDDEPIKKAWLNKQLFYQHTRQFLKRSAPRRLLCIADQALMHVTFLIGMAGIAWGAVAGNWIMLGVSLFAILLTSILRTIIMKKAMARFHEQIPSWKLLPYELTTVWRTLALMIRYRRADKYDFTSHKL